MPSIVLARHRFAIKGVLVGLLIWASVARAAGGTGPSFSAFADIPGTTGQVALDLYQLPGMFAEYRMVLRFKGLGGSTSFEPIEDTGGHTRMSLYTTPSSDIVVLGTAGRDVFFNARTGTAGGLSGRIDEPLTYIGAFDFVRTQNGRGRELRLITPAQGPECIPTMADWAKPGPNRTEAYRVSCR